ncbi:MULTISPECIES: translation initiation factor IF-2 [unclassified Sedimentibacter]|uniref:translation initiation factor IF-2 n=1 Tax=unclassified Sedimentibacter TaxID=2649220 RepID=UPI0027E096D8|nr:translation initiation factor IF-2 [Sedimentibacter sp. MB35-C1]WMJ76144.1 translation initiation factor IF-2 [Sedimentibacter sp. MB35-C1]
MRIYELAKELKMNSKDLVALAEQELGITIKNHMSSITDLEVIRLKKALNIINSNKKAKAAKGAKNAVIDDDEPLVDEKIDLNQAKLKKVDKKLISPVKKQQVQQKPRTEGGEKGSSKGSAKGKNNFNKKNQKKSKNKPQQPQQQKPAEHERKENPKIKNIEIEESIVVREFADKLGVPVNLVISKLILLGIMANMNQEIDFATAQLIGEELGAKITKIEVVDELQNLEDSLAQEDTDDEKDMLPRPPIVTVMGHVDHGKTSLLDAIRNTAVTEHEAGGITQHIGASQVEINGKKITFLDTPGHEAFTSMRARGAKVTDIAIIVVAADDGVMPQTIEAINHSKAAGVPIIVAVNKIDKPTANMDRVKQELSEQGIISEDWGGDTIFVPVSAKKRMGIEDLLEMILLVAEVQELKANPNRAAKGTIVEAKLDKGRGPVATVLIEKGTLSKGDIVLVGSAYGKVRAMFNYKGKKINQAGPSVPVEILGLSETPQAGDILVVMENEKDAKNIAEKRKDKRHQETMNATSKVSLDDLFDRIQKGEVKDLNIIIKADVSGSIEAVKQSLLKQSMDEVKVNPIHGGVGGINENDVMLASASNAIVIGFNVRPSIAAMELAKKENVDVRTYNIIYNAIEDIQQAVKGMLAPVYKEVVQGRAEVRQTFKVPNVGIVAGVYVTSGKITRKSKIRLLRNDIVIHEGEISSLKRFKDDVSELNTGYEGGIGIEKYNNIKEGDSMEAYIMEEIKR